MNQAEIQSTWVIYVVESGSSGIFDSKSLIKKLKILFLKGRGESG